jgi:hypothetical protein
MTEIKQGTNEWLAAKKQYIGGSEIYGLAHHYCKNELEAIGIDLYKEKPFTGAQELFLKVKFGFDLARKDTAAMKSLLAFGNAMEGYVFKRLQGELNTGYDNRQIKLEQKHDFVVNKDMHDYACCSPDGYIDLVDDRSLQVRGLPDYSITKEMGRGALELKTARHDALQGLLDENVGAPAKYMLQNQYQMMVLGKKWGVISILLPREKNIEIEGLEFPSDDPFVKGSMMQAMLHDEFEYLYNHYELITFAHPIYQQYQDIINKSLKLFKEDIDNNNVPTVHDDYAATARVREMMRQIRPEGFDVLELKETDELDQLINDRQEAQALIAKNTDAKKEIEAEIMKRTKAKYSKVIGTENKVSYSTKGSPIFTKIK